ncbi:MAG: ELM1/GtrOC1 family putative glycosyltransferase [Roseobacter sp.]
MSGYVKARTSDRAPHKLGNRDFPLVWVLQGHRAGDVLQVQALADGLGWPWQGKSLIWRKKWYKRLPYWTPLYGRSCSLRHLRPEAKEAFQPPWPDVVFSIGWRSVPIARWIKEQSGARLVHLGRPRAPLKYFDLVLTTPQYRLPSTKNVVHLNGPLTTLSPDMLAASANAWEARLAHLPRPWIAVLVGGDTPRLKFPPSAAAALANASNERAASCEGSLLVVTSPRTSEHVTKVLRDAIRAPAFFHEWTKHADNPYAAFLALADQFIVTGDSISMTHEAALTERPLLVFPLKSKGSLTEQALLALDRKMRCGKTMIAKTYLSLIRNGVIYPPKSAADYFHALMQNGRASVLGSSSTLGEIPPMQPENGRAVKAVKALFDPGRKGKANRD